jgi:PPM family protein phosphatase
MIRTYSFSTAGGHLVNEDCFVLHPLPREEGFFVALADGQGGRAGGQRAAQIACETAISRAVTQPAAVLRKRFAWVDSLTRADAAVAADASAGFCTLVGLHVTYDRVIGASCGDSAAIVACSATNRVLTERQTKNPPVGNGDATFVPFEMELVAPWRLMVLSDGAWKYASWDRVWDCARLSGEALIAELQDAARLKTTGAFQDDFTVVLLESE